MYLVDKFSPAAKQGRRPGWALAHRGLLPVSCPVRNLSSLLLEICILYVRMHKEGGYTVNDE